MVGCGRLIALLARWRACFIWHVSHGARTIVDFAGDIEWLLYVCMLQWWTPPKPLTK